MNEGDGSMLFRESETIELKEVVVDEIKKYHVTASIQYSLCFIQSADKSNRASGAHRVWPPTGAARKRT